MPGRCHFNDSWLHLSEFKLWLRKHSDEKAFCSVCNKSFSISSNGINQIKTHANGKAHSSKFNDLHKKKQMQLNFAEVSKPTNTNQKNEEIKKTVNCENENEATKSDKNAEKTVGCEMINHKEAAKTPNNTGSNASVTASISPYQLVAHPGVVKGEILWTICTVIYHESYRSSGALMKATPLIFSDSAIAKTMALQKDKISYTIAYGLGPYFENCLLKVLKSKDVFALSIDESLNKISQKAQLDVIIRYWDNGSVKTSYLKSLFLNSCTADSLLKSLVELLEKLDLKIGNMIQLAMDGPNVNLKMFSDLLDFLEAKDDVNSKLLDTGTCTLHIVHGAFKTAHNKQKWEIHKFLRSIYYLFKDFPTRRSEYTNFSGSELFPQKFCGIRWAENCLVLRRAIEILPNIAKYIDGAEKEKRKPKSDNFGTVKEIINDELLLAKLEFMLAIGNELQHFLIFFQSDRPCLPFLYDEMILIIQNISKRFSSEVVWNKKNIDNHILPAKKIDIGTGAKLAIRKVSLVKQLEFKESCKNFLKDLLLKLLEKLPFRNKTIKGASCLAPKVVLAGEEVRKPRIEMILESFVQCNIFESSEADSILRSYSAMSETKFLQDEFKKFDEKIDRLDHFYVRLYTEFPNLFDRKLQKFIQTICVMFHGNAAVERGFSVNGDILVENLREDSLIGQRRVYDFMKSINFKLEDLDVNTNMMKSFIGASKKRKDELKRKQEEKSTVEIKRKRAMEEIKVLTIKKAKLMEEKESALQNLDANIAFLKNSL